MAPSAASSSEFLQIPPAAARVERLTQRLRAILRDGRGATLPVLILTALVLFIRRPDAFLNPQLWGEDGKVFFLQQWEQGVRALCVPYAGYLNTTQRLVAWLADISVDVGNIPLFYNSAAFAGTLFCAWFVLRSRLNVPYKPLMALSLVLIPHGLEVFMNMCNLNWILSTLVVILAIQENPRTRGEACLDLCVLVLVGLTGPLATILSPLLLIRPLLFGASRYNKLIFVVTLAIVGVQGYFLLHSPRAVLPPRNWFGIGRMIIRHFVPGLLVGQHTRTALGLTLLISLITVAIRSWRGSSPQVRRIQALVFGAFTLVLGVTLCCGPIPEAYDPFECGPRYHYVPYVLATWFFLLGLGSTQWRAKELAAVVSAMILIAGTAHLVSAPLPDLDWRRHIQPLAEGKPARIPLNPEFIGPIVVKPRPDWARR